MVELSIPYRDERIMLCQGDAVEVLKLLPDASVEAVVTDPPYLLGFMGKEWDTKKGHEHTEWHSAWASECFRLLKPGGYLLAMGGSRTWHRLACAIEDAGFEIRDSIAWLYGSGFPKSMDVSKAIDKAAGAEREVVGRKTGRAAAPVHSIKGGNFNNTSGAEQDTDIGLITAPATDAAKQWQGWGTALKPAFEPIVVARKPLAGTVAANVLAHGTGALNIDACRVAYESGGTLATNPSLRESINGGNGGNIFPTETERRVVTPNTAGRWPANVVLDEHYEPVIRLRDNLPSGIERVIREFFNASTDHLPTLWRDDDGSPEPTATSPVLQEAVLLGLDGRASDGRESSALGQRPHSGISAEDVGHEAGAGTDRQQESTLEGRHPSEPRICDGEDGGAVAPGSADVCLDETNESDSGRLHSSASIGGGTEAGSAAATKRARASHQWGQGRQPGGEPRGSLERGAQAQPCGSRARAVPATGRESRSAGTPLEILRRDCPSGWLSYFTEVGTRREGQAAELDKQSGTTSGRPAKSTMRGEGSGSLRVASGVPFVPGNATTGYEDSGGASRFFPVFKYQAKAPAKERPKVDGVAHPTVKPIDLFRWLVRLVTPEGGTIIDPFAGSGTTGEAALLEDRNIILIERQDEYIPLILARIERQTEEPVA